jgi:hypothetical protein
MTRFAITRIIKGGVAPEGNCYQRFFGSWPWLDWQLILRGVAVSTISTWKCVNAIVSDAQKNLPKAALMR